MNEMSTFRVDRSSCSLPPFPHKQVSIEVVCAIDQIELCFLNTWVFDNQMFLENINEVFRLQVYVFLVVTSFVF